MSEVSVDWTVALGFLAMSLSVTSFAPQAYKIIRSRDTSSLSTAMYVITVAGFACWLAYGVLTRDWPVVVSNAVCGLVATFILIMKLLPQAKKEAVADTLAVSDKA